MLRDVVRTALCTLQVHFITLWRALVYFEFGFVKKTYCKEESQIKFLLDYPENEGCKILQIVGNSA